MGVSKTCTEAELKSAYKKLALKWHPDRNQGSEEQKAKADKMFKDINEAYGVLSDTNKRRQYDLGFDVNDQEGGFPGGAGFPAGGIDPN